MKLCEPLGEIQKRTVNPHLPHEIAETAVNFIIKERLAKELLTAPDPQKDYVNILKPLTQRLPTQTWRSPEQIKWQQFSTPAGIAYLLAYLLNLKEDNEVLEPSSGTGTLAVWTSGLRIKTHTNELDERRKILLECLGFQPTGYNAEFINDYLPSEIKPNCLIMNPPFSSNGGRTKNNSSEFGFRHVQSNLERLKKGGKLGIILGNSAGLDTRTGEKFWHKLSELVRKVKSFFYNSYSLLELPDEMANAPALLIYGANMSLSVQSRKKHYFQ